MCLPKDKKTVCHFLGMSLDFQGRTGPVTQTRNRSRTLCAGARETKSVRPKGSQGKLVV